MVASRASSKSVYLSSFYSDFFSVAFTVYFTCWYKEVAGALLIMSVFLVAEREIMMMIMGIFPRLLCRAFWAVLQDIFACISLAEK